MKNEIVDKNYLYFKENFKLITSNHLNEYVVIYDCKVVNYFSSITEAIDFMKSQNVCIGDFIVQKCTEFIDTTYAIYYSTYVNNFCGVGK